jgi:hypothetical protein
MHLDIVALCDAAVETNGRFNIIGTIDYFWAATLPYTYPKCVLALRMRFEHFEAGKHRVDILLVDEDGKGIVAPTRFELNVIPVNEDIPILRHLVLELRSLRLEKYGHYAIHVAYDGAHQASVPFSVVSPRRVRPTPSEHSS